MYYYSKINDKKIIFSLFKFSNFKKNRIDFTPDTEYLQGSCTLLNKNKKIQSHKHKSNQRIINITQEAWLIFRGSVKAKFFDIDDSYFKEIVLTVGDCVVLFNGGHSFNTLEADTILFEFKNGPYYGAKKDRIEID